MRLPSIAKADKYDYYTSDSLWKVWLVESIQSIQNGLWTWHDKCNICSRYCIYHVKFNVCLVTKPLGVFSSETKWLNALLLFLRMNYVKKCIIKQLLNSVFAWYHELSKPRVCVICLSLRLPQITYSTSSNNRPFYSCLLSDLAFEWQRGWRWPCFDTDLSAFVV